MAKTIYLFSLAFSLFLHPALASAQCKDQLCASLHNILDAAAIDFRGYGSPSTPLPEVSTESAKVPCSISTWANNVRMVVCYAQIPVSSALGWSDRALNSLKILDPSWHLNIKSPGEDRYVDAGPPGCEPTPTEGPYIGQCPLHLEAAKQADGSSKIYLIVNSLSSPYLLPRSMLSPTPKKPASTPAGVGLSAATGCDDICQALKKALEARTNGFAEPHPAKLPTAKDCLVKVPASGSGAPGVSQFVCYWQEGSPSAGEARFRDLVARLQVLVPSDWSSAQANELDEQTGAPLNAWRANDSGNKYAVRVYLAGEFVGLHISTYK